MREQIVNILRNINPNIVDGIDLIENGLIDSFEVVNIIMELEETFEIEIDPDDVVAENFQNIDRVCRLVQMTIDKSK